MTNRYILKYSDDTVLIFVLNASDSPVLHQQGVTKLIEWCEINDLHINTSKTEEIIYGSRFDGFKLPVVIHNETIGQV